MQVPPGQAKARTEPLLGLYFHVPFCGQACDFCAFYQEAPSRAEVLRYLQTMEAELALLPPPRPVETVFWGGGTPGLLAAKDLERLGRVMLERLPAPPTEWTVEMTPASIKRDKLQVLRDLGVTRISVGVQSFEPKMLEALGRPHGLTQINRALEAARQSGFPNLNLDLIFAIPGQTLDQWRADLRAAMACEPQHLSTYCLTFEEDTALWLRLQKGEVQQRSEAEEAAFYEVAADELARGGYAQYEVSNFARPGWACRHNLNTWAMHEWIGYGPSASSQFGGRRWMNEPNLDRWAAGVAAGQLAQTQIVGLTAEMIALDRLVFGLRMNAGVPWPAPGPESGLSGALHQAVNRFLRDLVDEGLAWRRDDRLGLTPIGRLLADRIGSEILALGETVSA